MRKYEKVGTSRRKYEKVGQSGESRRSRNKQRFCRTDTERSEKETIRRNGGEERVRERRTGDLEHSLECQSFGDAGGVVTWRMV